MQLTNGFGFGSCIALRLQYLVLKDDGELDPSDCQDSASKDWAADSKGEATLGEEAFKRCWFQLADVHSAWLRAASPPIEARSAQAGAAADALVFASPRLPFGYLQWLPPLSQAHRRFDSHAATADSLDASEYAQFIREMMNKITKPVGTGAGRGGGTPAAAQSIGPDPQSARPSTPPPSDLALLVENDSSGLEASADVDTKSDGGQSARTTGRASKEPRRVWRLDQELLDGMRASKTLTISNAAFDRRAAKWDSYFDEAAEIKKEAAILRKRRNQEAIDAAAQEAKLKREEQALTAERQALAVVPPGGSVGVGGLILDAAGQLILDSKGDPVYALSQEDSCEPSSAMSAGALNEPTGQQRPSFTSVHRNSLTARRNSTAGRAITTRNGIEQGAMAGSQAAMPASGEADALWGSQAAALSRPLQSETTRTCAQSHAHDAPKAYPAPDRSGAGSPFPFAMNEASVASGVRFPPVGNAATSAASGLMGATSSKMILSSSTPADDGLTAMMTNDDAPSLSLCEMHLTGSEFSGATVDSSEFAPARSAAGLLMDWEQRWDEGVMRWKRLGRRIPPPPQPPGANARIHPESGSMQLEAQQHTGHGLRDDKSKDAAQASQRPPALLDAEHMDPKLVATGSLVARLSHPQTPKLCTGAGMSPRQNNGGLVFSSMQTISSFGLSTSSHRSTSSHPLHLSPRKPAPPPLQHTPKGVGYLDDHGVLRYRRRCEYFGDLPSAQDVVALARIATLPASRS